MTPRHTLAADARRQTRVPLGQSWHQSSACGPGRRGCQSQWRAGRPAGPSTCRSAAACARGGLKRPLDGETTLVHFFKTKLNTIRCRFFFQSHGRLLVGTTTSLNGAGYPAILRVRCREHEHAPLSSATTAVSGLGHSQAACWQCCQQAIVRASMRVRVLGQRGVRACVCVRVRACVCVRACARVRVRACVEGSTSRSATPRGGRMRSSAMSWSGSTPTTCRPRQKEKRKSKLAARPSPRPSGGKTHAAFGFAPFSSGAQTNAQNWREREKA